MRAVFAAAVVVVSLDREALAAKPRKPPATHAAPKPKRKPMPSSTPARTDAADDARSLRESAETETSERPTVDVVTGPQTSPAQVGPIALAPERAKDPPIAASSPSGRAPGAEGPSAFTAPHTMWPVYTAGVVGLAGLTAAIVLGSLSDDAKHAVDVAEGSLVRAGATRARCAQSTVGTPFDGACGAIRRNESVSRSLNGTLPVSLAIGIPALAFAVSWYFLAPKKSGALAAEAKARAARALPQLSTWVTATSGGASLEGHF